MNVTHLEMICDWSLVGEGGAMSTAQMLFLLFLGSPAESRIRAGGGDTDFCRTTFGDVRCPLPDLFEFGELFLFLRKC